MARACSPGLVWDSHALKCRHCRDICSQTNGTRCHQLCPGLHYGRQRRHRACEDGLYYDATLRRCQHCHDVCDVYWVQDTETLCRQSCPKYFLSMAHPSTTTASAPARLPGTLLSSSTPSGDHGPRPTLVTSILAIGILASVLMCLVLFVAIPFLYGRDGIKSWCSSRRWISSSDTKRSVPCSEDSLEGVDVSSKSALMPSGLAASGHPQPRLPEAGHPKSRLPDLGHHRPMTDSELGAEQGNPFVLHQFRLSLTSDFTIPCLEMDGPGTASTTPKQIYDSC